MENDTDFRLCDGRRAGGSGVSVMLGTASIVLGEGKGEPAGVERSEWPGRMRY